jgi:hypothetical protein
MPIPYLFVLGGMGLLYLDLRGLFRVERRRLVWWRWIGIAAAAGAGLAPILGWATGRLVVGGWWPFGVIAAGYLISAAAFALGALDLAENRGRLGLRRYGYIGLILLSLIPSWTLVALAPLVMLAGIGLVRAKPEAGA